MLISTGFRGTPYCLLFQLSGHSSSSLPFRGPVLKPPFKQASSLGCLLDAHSSNYHFCVLIFHISASNPHPSSEPQTMYLRPFRTRPRLFHKHLTLLNSQIEWKLTPPFPAALTLIAEFPRLANGTTNHPRVWEKNCRDLLDSCFTYHTPSIQRIAKSRQCYCLNVSQTYPVLSLQLIAQTELHSPGTNHNLTTHYREPSLFMPEC